MPRTYVAAGPALLGLNCGMTSVDMGTLRKEQVNGGRMVRKRVKTGDYANVPTVEYALWPETLKLLKENWSDDETLVLTSQDGTPMYTNAIEGEATPQKDLITQQWKRAKLPIQLKAFRSIAATRLESHREYGRYKTHFLGHSPKLLADKNYAAPSAALFDQGQLLLRDDVRKDFHQEALIPATEAAFHGDAVVAGMLLQER